MEPPTSALFICRHVAAMFSMSFKVSAAPFHFWTPDVYDGAPTVFTSFMATIVKMGAFIAFIRLFNEAFGNLQSQWQLLIAIITAHYLIYWKYYSRFSAKRKKNACLFKHCAGGIYDVVRVCNEPGCKGRIVVIYCCLLSCYDRDFCRAYQIKRLQF